MKTEWNNTNKSWHSSLNRPYTLNYGLGSNWFFIYRDCFGHMKYLSFHFLEFFFQKHEFFLWWFDAWNGTIDHLALDCPLTGWEIVRAPVLPFSSRQFFLQKHKWDVFQHPLILLFWMRKDPVLLFRYSGYEKMQLRLFRILLLQAIPGFLNEELQEVLPIRKCFKEMWGFSS